MNESLLIGGGKISRSHILFGPGRWPEQANLEMAVERRTSTKVKRVMEMAASKTAVSRPFFKASIYTFATVITGLISHLI